MNPFCPAKFPPEVQACMQYQGYRRALLSNMRYGPFGDISGVYRRLGKQPRPTLLLWGTADEAIAFPVSDRVRQALPYAR